MNKHFIISAIALPSLLASLLGGTGISKSGFYIVQNNGDGYITVTESGGGAGGGGAVSGETGGNGSALNVPSSGNTSLNWAGYAATGGSFTGVGANWVVPAATAVTSSVDGLSADATWIGIGGVSSRDLIQAGTQTVFQNGSPTYEAWYETLPADSTQVPLTIHPGDAVQISINQTGSNPWQVSFADTTTGQNYSTSVNYQSSLSSAEWIEEMPSDQRGFVGLDNFGTAAFTDAFAIENGARVTIAGANGQAMTMLSNANQVLANASALGTDGASFTVTRTAATSSAAGSVGFGRGVGSGGGRWSRTGVGLEGYAPHARQRTTTASTSSPSTSQVRSFFRGFPFFQMYQNR